MATAIGAFSLLGWVYLGLLHGRFWQPLFAAPAIDPVSWPSIDIIVPARNEADILPRSLGSLLLQDYPGTWRIFLIDDHSTDGTGDIARKIAAQKNQTQRLEVITAPDLPKGWSGKVAAMQAGVARSQSDYILFTDADIAHPKDSLRKLAARAVEMRLDLTSLMVKLHCTTFAEKLLIPAFVFFLCHALSFRPCE